MKGQKAKSKWNNGLSLTQEKTITRNHVTCDTFGSQGLSLDGKCDKVGAILDTPYLLTLDSLLNTYGDKFKMIFIIEMDPTQFECIEYELNKRKSSLKSKKYANVRPIHKDVFDFLNTYKGKIDYMWLDLTCAVLKKHELDAIMTKLSCLACLAITISCHGNLIGEDRSVDKRVAKMYSQFKPQLPYNVLGIRYTCGGGPMRVFAFGRIPAKYINIISLAAFMRGDDLESGNNDEYEEDSFCDMSPSSDEEDSQPVKKSKRVCVDDVWDLGKSYRMR